MAKKHEDAVNMAYEDTMDFLRNDTEKWAKESCCGSFIAYGLLNAVFQMIFELAPNDENAMEIIMMSLSNFTGEQTNDNN